MRHSVILGHRGAVSATPRPARNTEKHKLSVATGLAALSLDAMASVSYGPEAIVLVLALADGRDQAAGGAAPFLVDNAHTIDILLLLKALSSGCAALTGVEAIANAVPSFKTPRVRNAQRAEVVLGILLGTMLIGLAVLIEKFSLTPVEGTTVLSQLTSASLGNGVGYYVVQFSTVILLALAANTSYGGLPNLMRLLTEDNVLPHRFSRKSRREVFTYGVLSLGGVAALLLLASGGHMNTLVPLFAIGVFIGFTLAQFGMVRHWLAERTPGWKWRLALNGFGALLTAVAAVVTTAM